MKISIRQEIASDYKKVYEINKLAFNQENESKLIKKIRKGENYVSELSLVAEIEDTIVGHILFSKITIAGNSLYDSLALAPMAVQPQYQNKGIGSKLVARGLEKAKELGFDSIIVLGHKDFYPKFGFQRASQWGIKCPFKVPDEAFMAIELTDNALDGKSGIVQYPDEFNDVE